MKKLLALCLMLFLLLLPGCAEDTPEEEICFYYPRRSFLYGSAEGVISPEHREVAQRIRELPYMISLYLRGPLDETLRSPFPAGCKLMGVNLDGGTLCVTLDDSLAELEKIDLTVACACIAKTCFSLADVTQVQIRTESTGVNMVISIDSLLLSDGALADTHTITEEQS